MVKNAFCTTLIFFILFNITIRVQAGDNPFRGPWDQPPAVLDAKSSQWNLKETQSPFLLQNLAIKGLLFFQRTISPIDGDRCPMYPSCSTYCIESIRKHGIVLGSIMTTARLTQEKGEMKDAPKIIVNGSYQFYDPVENNDFWFPNSSKY